MAADGSGEGPDTFGHWRKPTSAGLGSLGLIGTVILFIGLIVFVLALHSSLLAGGVVAVGLAAVLAPLVVSVHGRSGAQRITAQLAWWWGCRRRRNLYRSGMTSPVGGGRHRLPGLAAGSRVWDCVDAYERPFGMVQVPATRHCSVTFDCAATGEALVDEAQVSAWVAGYDRFLAAMGHEPNLEAVAVTVETAPDTGNRLRRAVAARADPHAPAFARQVLAEIVDTYPGTSAQVSTRVQLTYRMTSAGGVRSVAEMAVELGTRLPGLGQLLTGTGAGHVHPMTGGELARVVRVAYDPDAAAAVEADAARSLPGTSDQAGTEHDDTDADTPDDSDAVSWENAGPVFAEERRDLYLHDSAATTCWGWSDAPRGVVTARVLLPLLKPHRDITRKRVTVVYRPHDAGKAAAIVETDVRNARFNATKRAGGARAADDASLSAALQSAREEARGAGLTRVSLIVTASVTDPTPASVRQARVTVEGTLGPAAHLGLRRAYGCQAATFAATLPVGIVLSAHSRVPSGFREAL